MCDEFVTHFVRYKREDYQQQGHQFELDSFGKSTKMKVVLAFAALVVAVSAAPQLDKDAVILRSDFENIGVGDYRYAYQTSNGISAEEQGQLNNVGRENEALAVRGQYSYVGPDGVTYSVTYVADENGFQPQGAHLPQA